MRITHKSRDWAWKPLLSWFRANLDPRALVVAHMTHQGHAQQRSSGDETVRYRELYTFQTQRDRKRIHGRLIRRPVPTIARKTCWVRLSYAYLSPWQFLFSSKYFMSSYHTVATQGFKSHLHDLCIFEPSLCRASAIFECAAMFSVLAEKCPHSERFATNYWLKLITD